MEQRSVTSSTRPVLPPTSATSPWRSWLEIPFPHLTVYAGAAKDGTAPAFRVLQAQSRESAVEPPTAP